MLKTQSLADTKHIFNTVVTNFFLWKSETVLIENKSWDQAPLILRQALTIHIRSKQTLLKLTVHLSRNLLSLLCYL